jgi:hypothetical protein
MRLLKLKDDGGFSLIEFVGDKIPRYVILSHTWRADDEVTFKDLTEGIGRNQGRWKEAEELFGQVMETRKRVLGVEHPSTLTSMANLASTYMNQGRWKEAEQLNVQVMETRKRVLGAKHPSVPENTCLDFL